MKPLTIIVALSAWAAFAGVPVELKNAGFHETDGKGGAVGWSHHPNWHAEKAGHNGSGALVWECAAESDVKNGGPGQEVQLKPGKRYDFSAIFKPDGVVTQRKSVHQGLTLYVEGYDANGKWMFGDMARPPAAGKSDEWIKIEGLTREIPDGVAKAYFRVIAKRCVSGRGAVDNVYLAERETVAVEGVFPHVYRRESTGGPVRFSASINTDVHENKLEDYSAKFTYVAADGRRMTAQGELASPVEAVATLDTSLFAFGTNDVVCTLFLKGKELGSAKVPFAHLAKPAPRRVYIDRHLRAIVDGKPFFPFGMCYWGEVTKEGLERYAEGPFNCVNTDWSMQPEQLELCREKGLLAICGLEKGFDEPDEGQSWLTERVNAMKNHPAVMGWFVSDEQPIADIPKMRRRQGWMETLDPNHPTWFALDTVREARHYLGTADVMGLDPYPIPTKPIGLVHSTTCRGVTNTFGAMANWQFPQAFGWGWLKRRETKGQRAPTQKEMANMGWQAIAGGANGLIFYAYQHLSEPHDDPEDAFDPAWARTKAMAEEFRKYIDVFLSVDPAPTAKSSNDDVAVRTWRHQGDTYLLVVNCTTNAQTATITLSEPLGKDVIADFAPAPDIEGNKVRVALDPISYMMLRAKKSQSVFVQDREVFVHDANYDKDKIQPYTLENPLAFADGRKVSSASDWSERRREILGIFAKEMYGAEPPQPETLVTELVDEKDAIDGLAVRRQYKMWFKADRTGPCITWIMWIPKPAKKPVPIISFLNYRGNHELVPDEDIPVQQGWTRGGERFGVTNFTSSAMTRGVMQDPGNRSVFPVGMILARGYAVMSACYCEVSPDPERDERDPRFMQNPFAYTGVFDLWGPRDPSRTDNITALGAWAWALSRGLDLAERVPELDAKRAVVTGCSRLGKAALIAAARDERFAVCVPNQTGGGGVPLAKRDYGENVSTENRYFTHWYCRAYAKYAEAPWRDMPFDQHLFIACIAPRALLVEGFDSRWFDTEGEYLSVKAASPVWTFLGKGGMPDVAWPADYDTSAIGRHLGYVRRAGSHGLSACDWTWLMDFADGVFGDPRR